MNRDADRPGRETMHLCVTCGEFKPSEKFHAGDCTCKDCNDEGRNGVNYDLDEETGEPVARRCDRCQQLLGEHGVARMDRSVWYICPAAGDPDE